MVLFHGKGKVVKLGAYAELCVACSHLCNVGPWWVRTHDPGVQHQCDIQVASTLPKFSLVFNHQPARKGKLLGRLDADQLPWLGFELRPVVL